MASSVSWRLSEEASEHTRVRVMLRRVEGGGVTVKWGGALVKGAVSACHGPAPAATRCHAHELVMDSETQRRAAPPPDGVDIPEPPLIRAEGAMNFSSSQK